VYFPEQAWIVRILLRDYPGVLASGPVEIGAGLAVCHRRSARTGQCTRRDVGLYPEGDQLQAGAAKNGFGRAQEQQQPAETGVAQTRCMIQREAIQQLLGHAIILDRWSENPTGP